MASIRCGNRKAHDMSGGAVHHHESVGQVKLCHVREGGLFSVEEREAEYGAPEFDADAAYERHLETRDEDFHRASEDWEAQMGAQSYSQARAEWEAREARS